MNKPKIILSLVLPIVILLSAIVKSEYQVRSGETWVFKIGAYDPRHLLKGQYLRFQVLWDWEKDGESRIVKNNSSCLCLMKKQGTVKVSNAQCESISENCDGFIRNKYLSRLEKYYIPENRGKVLEEKIRNKKAEIVLAINTNGYPVIKNMLIDGQPLEEGVE